jgi:integrase
MAKWTALKKHGCVFENPRTGEPWASEADQRDLYLVPTLKRLRMRHKRAYDTRATCATIMLMGSMDPAYCAGQLGHSVAVFFAKYAKWINGKRNDEQRAKFNKALERHAAEAKDAAA